MEELDVEFADIPSEGSDVSDNEEDNNDIQSVYVVTLPSTAHTDLPIILADDDTAILYAPIINANDDSFDSSSNNSPPFVNGAAGSTNSSPINSPSVSDDEFEDECLFH